MKVVAVWAFGEPQLNCADCNTEVDIYENKTHNEVAECPNCRGLHKLVLAEKQTLFDALIEERESEKDITDAELIDIVDDWWGWVVNESYDTPEAKAKHKKVMARLREVLNL